LNGILHIVPTEGKGSEQEILVERRNRDMIQEIQVSRDCPWASEVLCPEIEEGGDRMSRHKSLNAGFVKEGEDRG